MTYTADQLNNREERLATNKKCRLIGILFLRFFISFLLSGLMINDSGLCLSTAFVGASGSGISGVFALIGCCLGYSLYFGFDEAAIYIASAVMIYTVSFVFQYSVIYQNRFFKPFNVALILGVSSAFGLVSTIRGEQSLYSFIVGEALLGGLMTYVYEALFKDKANRVNHDYHWVLCLLIFMASVVLSLERYVLFDCISIGKVIYIISLLVLLCGFDGLAICLYAMILTVGVHEQEYKVFVFFVFFCEFLNVKTKITVSIGLFIITILFVLSDPANLINLIYNTTASIIIFLILPRRWLYLVKELIGSESIKKRSSLFEGKNDNKINLSEVLTEVSNILRLSRKTIQQQDGMEVFKEATESVCADCIRKDVCWENHQSQLLEMFLEMKEQVELRGIAISEDYSAWFREYCPLNTKLLDEINDLLRKKVKDTYQERGIEHVYNSMSEIINILSALTTENKRQCGNNESADILEHRIRTYLSSNTCDCDVFVSYFGEQRTKIEIVGSKVYDFLENDDTLNELSAIANMRLRIMNDPHNKNEILLFEAEPYAVSVGIAAKKKKGEKMCGDGYSYFKTEFGHFYLILSDGLGTGEHAFEQSSLVIEVLERLLINGVMPNDAVRLTNLIVSMNNPEELDCATIDLLCMDLYSGVAEFFKLGAAPSYLFNDELLKVFAEKNLSAGNLMQEGTDLYRESIQMNPGDVILMMSDGVSIKSESALKEVVNYEGGTMKNLAREVLIHSLKSDEHYDDSTAIAIKMELRK